MKEILEKITSTMINKIKMSSGREVKSELEIVSHEKLAQVLSDMDKRIEMLESHFTGISDGAMEKLLKSVSQPPQEEKECSELCEKMEEYYKEKYPNNNAFPPTSLPDWTDKVSEVIKTLKDIPGKNLYLTEFILESIQADRAKTIEFIKKIQGTGSWNRIKVQIIDHLEQ